LIGQQPQLRIRTKMRGDLLRLGFVDIQLVRQQGGVVLLETSFHVLQVQLWAGCGTGVCVGAVCADKDAAAPNTRTENQKQRWICLRIQ